MKRWFVTYSESRLMEIEVEADNEEEAERIVMDGEADYATATEIDNSAEIMSVNHVEFSGDSDPGDDE